MNAPLQSCRHCGEPVTALSPAAPDFCCSGCAGAYALLGELGLKSYYNRRAIDPKVRALRPDEDEVANVDFTELASTDGDGNHHLNLMVDGIHCAACVWLIETLLQRNPTVLQARVNMTTRRLRLSWQGELGDIDDIIRPVMQMGYRLIPFDPAALEQATASRNKELLRCLAVAGFAAGNVMLLSVSVWAGYFQGMGGATRDLFHWISALIALPAAAYAGLPFYRSAVGAIRNRRVNMDVPISLGVILALGMSLAQTIRGEPHAYFDSAITLLFFLLIGRYLDGRARGQARSAAEHLLSLNARSITVVEPDGTRRLIAPQKAVPGMTVLVAAGERIGIDGKVVDGQSDVDTSIITGESIPVLNRPGATVFAGTTNISAPLRIEVTATGGNTLLSEIVRLMENAEQGRARYVAIADRVAKAYAPVVHTLSLATFIGWWLIGGIGWQDALMNAIAVLIITCPCALALAVPVVQVIATGRLLRAGILVKSATALERLTKVTGIIFDKTGTLTTGKPELVGEPDQDKLLFAAGMAANSNHPLSRALVRAAGNVTAHPNVSEQAGLGLLTPGPSGPIRLGSRAFCDVAENADVPSDIAGPELWLSEPGVAPTRFVFRDTMRSDAPDVIDNLRTRGFEMTLLSGDRESTVRQLAETLGIPVWQARMSPTQKAAHIQTRSDEGKCDLMVGDGINDAPALAAAHASMSPATAAEISQNAADIVFQGDRLGAVIEAIDVARKADQLVRQNFALSFAYNVITIPLAVSGYVTPLIAAIAMSSSSLVVIANALRLHVNSGKPDLVGAKPVTKLSQQAGS
ncbi:MULTISPECIES: heavy metal translocating P-type ATPase metal-binding domain-containing protein [unclassified Thalassospira]|uniref:heavy metal translocating P-type ATPase metal-binding domain-containing protein n=1 Tax=unclassified Thalassospira TaxID=2648997 RepID=UPI0025D0DF8A|nr:MULTISPECIES: heavy metal translocating P-type ATPase metal-binding domain-containing protein [unclassified Thalassospira]|tara:strand:+ start:8680 stop:11103 length:2424 start_codon:yes stop_codon:yes gene_type:complete